MKKKIERRKPSGVADYAALAISTVGVGYLPLAPGTWGSAVGVAIYYGVQYLIPVIATSGLHLSAGSSEHAKTRFSAWIVVGIIVSLSALIFTGIWACTRAIPLLGNEDPSEEVIDEVMGQLVTFLFIPFGLPWGFVLAGFLLFRAFDIWKPWPIDSLQSLSGGLGVCADDLVAGVYAGICLAVGYAAYMS